MHANVAPAGFVIANVTELVSPVTVLPPRSCTFTTGGVPKATPPVEPLGWVVNASFAAPPVVTNTLELTAAVNAPSEAVNVYVPGRLMLQPANVGHSRDGSLRVGCAGQRRATRNRQGQRDRAGVGDDRVPGRVLNGHHRLGREGRTTGRRSARLNRDGQLRRRRRDGNRCRGDHAHDGRVERRAHRPSRRSRHRRTRRRHRRRRRTSSRAPKQSPPSRRSAGSDASRRSNRGIRRRRTRRSRRRTRPSRYPCPDGVAAIPTIGRFRAIAPVEPWNAASPNVKIPPSDATNQ